MTAPRAIFRSLSAALLFWHGMAPLGLAASDADDCTEFAARAREALQKFTHKTLSRDEAAKTAPSLRAELFTYLPRKERPTSLCYETALLITQLSLLAEWDTATVAQTELEKWWGQLEGLAPEFARGFTLRTSSLYLNRWMASDPIPLLTF